MLVNSSSFGGSSSPTHTTVMFMFTCMNTLTGMLNIGVFTFMDAVLVLPLCSFVLFLARRRRPATPISHSDILTYNIVVGDLIKMATSLLALCGILARFRSIVMLSIFLFSVMIPSQIMTHILACVDRYLAVVHPVTYRNLRNERGIRIRNLSIGGTWLFTCCFSMLQFLVAFQYILNIYISFCLLSIAIVSVCSVSVLCILIRPGPGEEGGARKQADQSKWRAFWTITAILGVLVFRFGGNVAATAIYSSMALPDVVDCGLWLSEFWLSLPCSLVLPLMNLHKAGRLPRCCKKQ